jgi:hypothetical protein
MGSGRSKGLSTEDGGESSTGLGICSACSTNTFTNAVLGLLNVDPEQLKKVDA